MNYRVPKKLLLLLVVFKLDHHISGAMSNATETRQSKHCGFSIYIFDIQSQSQWSGWSGQRRWSCLVFARKIARMILIQNIQGLMGPLMINMAFMPLYM